MSSTDIHGYFGLSYVNYLVIDAGRIAEREPQALAPLLRLIKQLWDAYPQYEPQTRIALAGRLAALSDLTYFERTEHGVTSNFEFIHDDDCCQTDEERWDHEAEACRWEYRGEDYERDEEAVLPVETAEYAAGQVRYVLPRTLLQSMPLSWQEEFVAAARAAGDADDREFQIRVLRADGLEIDDPVPHYRRGRTHIAPRLEQNA